MAETRHMLRALLYDRRTPPGAVLGQLDRTLHAITDNPPHDRLPGPHQARRRPLNAALEHRGTPPAATDHPGHRAVYLHAEPGVPLGVDIDQPRPDHHPLPADATVIFFTDSLVEHPHRSNDNGLSTLSTAATAHAHLPVDELCTVLADHHPSDGHDDLAILALRTPPRPNV